MVTTTRDCGMSFTVCVCGKSTSMPDCKMGAVIIKMMRSTRTTSTSGTILISESDVPVCLSCGISADSLRTHFFNLCRYFHGEIVHARAQISNPAYEIIVSDDGGNRREKPGGGGDESFRDAGSNGAQAGGARGA